MTQPFTASEVRNWERAYKGTGAAEVFDAFADILEAREKAVPVMVVNHVSSAEHDLPIGMKLYAHPAPSDESAQTNDDAEQLRACREDWQKVCDVIHPGWHFNPEEIVEKLKAAADAEKRETITPRELAKRIERGEKWKLADEPAPRQPQDAERLAEALRELASRWTGSMYFGMSDEDEQAVLEACANDVNKLLTAHSAQAQPPTDQFDPERNVRPGDIGTEAQPPAQSEYAPTYPDQAKDPFWKVPGMVDVRPKAQPPAVRVPDARDARRYQWLKHCTAGKWDQLNDDRLRGKLDTAIDVAMLAAQENPNG